MSTDERTKSLAELFDGRSQLLVYHFMFGPAYTAGCPVLLVRSGHLRRGRAAPEGTRRDVRCASLERPAREAAGLQAPIGWQFPWASSAGTDFNFDFGASHTEEPVWRRS